MAYPPQQFKDPAHASAGPSLIASAPAHRLSSHYDMPYGRSQSMAIPGVDTARDDVPPPLPPPRHLPFGSSPYQSDDMHRGVNDRPRAAAAAAAAAASSYGSVYGSGPSSSLADDASRRRRSPENDRDEGYASWSSNDRSLDSFPSRFGLHHNSFQFQSPADVHGDYMKKKLNPLRISDKSSSSILSASPDELLPRRSATDSRFPPELSIPPVKLPNHSSVLDSPTDSAVSPRSTHFGRLPSGDYRSARYAPGTDRSPRSRTHRNNSDDASSQGTYDYAATDEMEIDDNTSHKRLHLENGYVAGGQKRRAPSPRSMDANDMMRRRDTGGRGSPTPRLMTAIPNSAPVPPLSRTNSYVSTISIAPSTATTATSYDHRSPGAYSSGGVSPTSGGSPYATPISLNPSPGAAIPARTPVHARNVSNAPPKRLPELQKPVGTKVQAIYMCECCPKKPRKFETQEELRAHESEKQYNCAYCGNRFKNKNEAERHQNSLHVRRHSWSCSALSSCDRAFHESANRPGEADTCGYCGVNFPRSGVDAHGARVATDQDWAERVHHLDDTHKFRECNSSKKFYRADHFRQHLKHSHAGSSGKWTNMLENACMIEEEPPTPR